MALTTCQVAVTFAGPLRPAKPWRFIATLPRAQARGPKKAPLQPLEAAMVCRVSQKTAHGIICASVDRCTDSRGLELCRRAHV